MSCHFLSPNTNEKQAINEQSESLYTLVWKANKIFSDILLFFHFIFPLATWQGYLGRFSSLSGKKKPLHPIDALLVSRWICSWSTATLAPGSARSSDFSLGRIRSCFVQTALLWEVWVNAASRAAPSCQVLCQRSPLQRRCGFAGFLCGAIGSA